MKHSIKLLAVALTMSACGGANNNIDDDKQQVLPDAEDQTVEVEIAQVADFYMDIISNGKVSASSYADVYWETEGAIAKVNIHNGQTVRKGDTLARLDAFRLNNTLKTSKSNMEQARLQMLDNLIGQGYEPESTDIPENVKEIAEIKSGYRNAEAAYELAKYEAEHCAIVAPISGIVANVTASVSNKADLSKPACRIISQQAMDVEFSIIESELPLVAKGSSIEVTAFAFPNKLWTGTVSEVNPYIESNGMVKVKGRVSQCTDLYEGMNVSVRVKRNMGQCISVPKTAIVLRTGRPVVFTALNGEAQWVYVETKHENSTHVAITDGLNVGDSVIVSGNVFLAHKSKITVANKEKE